MSLFYLVHFGHPMPPPKNIEPNKVMPKPTEEQLKAIYNQKMMEGQQKPPNFATGTESHPMPPKPINPPPPYTPPSSFVSFSSLGKCFECSLL